MVAKVKNEEGFAILEAVVFLVSFMILAAYTIDFFTAIHSGVLGNIYARTYLFETLRHRADIDQLREYSDASTPLTFANNLQGHERFHGVNDEDQPPTDMSEMKVVGRSLTRVSDQTEGNLGTGTLSAESSKPTSVMYIKSGYGICTDAQCGKDGG